MNLWTVFLFVFVCSSVFWCVRRGLSPSDLCKYGAFVGCFVVLCGVFVLGCVRTVWDLTCVRCMAFCFGAWFMLCGCVCREWTLT